MSLVNRVLNVFAGLLNFALIVVISMLFILPFVWHENHLAAIHFALVFCVVAGVILIAIFNYLAFGVFRFWNKLPVR